VEVKTLLDTNVYSALMRGDRACLEHVRNAGQLALSTIVVGELLQGFYNGKRSAENVARLREFLDQPDVELLPVTYATADRFARVYAALRKRGTPIPTNDMWIAAHALETGGDLLSLDSHFQAIDGLALVVPR
jgi:tRNA(fMet)-specific endonuclease VapC